MSDIIENLEFDKDTVSADELEKLFSKKCNLLMETSVTIKNTFINKLSINRSLNIAASLLHNGIEVYQLNKASLSKVCKLSGHKNTLTELVFSPKEEHLLYSAGYDGVKLWDIRTGGMCVLDYSDETNSSARQYECLDVSCSGRLLVAGSQMVDDDAFLVFWDVRSPQPLGGYWNSHKDDITQVKFHKEKPEILASGSTDGLLNVYNILETSEDDALLYSLNTESSVDRLCWLDATCLCCITHQHDLQLWDAAAADPRHSYPRERIARGVKRLRADDCYLVDAYTASDGSTVILAGSYSEVGVLRSLNAVGGKLRPRTLYRENKQIVRCCAYDKERDILVTAGESSLVSLWRPVEGRETHA